jgi:hypothetical protein
MSVNVLFVNVQRMLAALALLLVIATTASAQQQGGQNIAGVEVDAKGVLRMKVVADPTGQLQRQALEAARVKLDRNLVRPSESRKISLPRLEAALAARLAAGQTASEDMKNLAGLSRIRHVYYFPETKDIVLEGPAEGFAADPTGRMIGIQSGRSILELQDLIVALRAFPPQGGGANVISVSIDPTKEGLAAMQQFLAKVIGRVTPGDANAIATGLRESLGLQVVTFRGVSTQTHFAQVLVEADYRMKLIGIGLEQPPVKIDSYVSRAKPADVSRNAMERWYFTPNYECVKVTEDRLAMELVGDGVKLIGENERVTAEGGRVNVAGVNKASQAFVQQFTAKYPELAIKSPVYGQLRNLIDLSVVAAYIQEQDFYGKSTWKMELFQNEQAYPVETYQTPREVESAVNVIWKGNTLMTPIGGGVQIQPKKALASANLQVDEGTSLSDKRAKVQVDKLANDQWWWD